MWWNQKNKMKIYWIIFALLLIGTEVFAQNSSDYFNRAANEYVYKNEQIALNTIDAGLSKFPNDKSLTNLKDKIQKDKKEQEQKTATARSTRSGRTTEKRGRTKTRSKSGTGAERRSAKPGTIRR